MGRDLLLLGVMTGRGLYQSASEYRCCGCFILNFKTESATTAVPEVVAEGEDVEEQSQPDSKAHETTPAPKMVEVEKRPTETESEEKVEEKSIVKPVGPEATPPKTVDMETSTLARRPLRSAPRSRKGTAAESETPTEEKSKVELGPSTRRSTGRRVQTEESEAGEATEEATEAVSPAIAVAVKKRPAPLAPLQAPMSSPAPSSGIDSTPNSPTSSISTVK